MGVPNRICGFPLIRQRSGGCWNTSFKVLHRVETGDSLGNVNVAVAHCQTATLAEHAGWWHGIKLLVAASALEFRHQGSETFVCPLAAHSEAGGFDIQSICHITGAIEWVGMK